ncbi:MAG: Oligopeptide-binding protein AppA [Chlamydiae bacterium]|nr:Oligopeptide-binding protein AppA [Chlamydiota bacterium]
MNREPIGLYIFRFVLGFGLFAFMCMLYWSSVMVEEDLKNLRTDIIDLKNDLYELRTETDAMGDEILQAISRGGVGRARDFSLETPSTSQEVMGRPHMDPSLPNLLHEDRFYEVTLPKLLEKEFEPTGTFQGAIIGVPDDLHPFSNWSQVSTWVSQCTVGLARLEVGKYETFAPDMALKIEERKQQGSDIPEYWVFLRDNVYWQPLSKSLFSEEIKLAPHFLRKHQVAAEDYKFYFDALMNPYFQEAGAVSLRNYLGDIEEIEVLDKLTFVVRWKTKDVVDAEGNRVPKIKYAAKLLTGQLRPLPSFVYKYFSDGTKIIEEDSAPDTYRTNSVWAQNFTEHWAKNIIVSCGPWIFEGKTDRQISFRRNFEHYFPYDVLAKEMKIKFKNTPDAIWQDFKSSRLDTYNLQPDQLIELDTFLQSDLYQEQAEKSDAVERLDYAARSYVYIGWNQAMPYFQSKKVRQAMTMAIDRNRIIQQYLNGMGIQITGPFSQNSSAYDQTIVPWSFNLQRARKLLEEEGWYDSDGDGIIDKEINGKRVPFEFSLTYYVRNPTTKAICEYVATALKELRIKCHLHGVDIADLSAAFDEKSFDALCLGWALGTPPEDPRQLWHSAGAKEKGSSNSVGFSNAEADVIIEKLTFEGNPEKRRELYHRFHAIIHEEQPYTFLYTPKTALLYRRYLQNVFIPKERQDLIPGADIAEPMSSIFWIKKSK